MTDADTMNTEQPEYPFLNVIAESIRSEYYRDYQNDGSRFVAWYLTSIYHINPVEVSTLVTDGQNDKCIDAIYVDDDDRTIHIIQGKYYKGQIGSSPIEECMHAVEGLNNLEDLENNANAKVRNLIPAVSTALDDGYSVKIELVTSGLFTPAAIDDGEMFSDNLEKNGLDYEFEMIDLNDLENKYNASLIENDSHIDHDVTLKEGQYMKMELSGTSVVIAALPISECTIFPGIKNGKLFKKNVRQSLGKNNKVNSNMRSSLKDDSNDFFFMHNGITAICTGINLEGNILHLKNVNIVNGCQSMTTFDSSSQVVKKHPELTVLFRFYEIPDNEKADKISAATNAQTAVKPRDMRSIDKPVLAIKQQYESMYKGAYLSTKRGEDFPKDSVPELSIDLVQLGKMLMTWNMQRPNWAYSELKIFDDYYLNLFGKKRSQMNNAANIRALSIIFNRVKKEWDNKTLDIEDILLAKPRYFLYDHIYAICRSISYSNKKYKQVPSPAKALELLEASNEFDNIIKYTAKAMNRAYIRAMEEKSFNVDNWYKNNKSLEKINDAIDSWIDYDTSKDMKGLLKLEDSAFYDRWTSSDD